VLTQAAKQLSHNEDRITEAYVNDVMPLDRYKIEMGKVQAQQQGLERAQHELERQFKSERESREALKGLEQFCSKIGRGLDSLSFYERQQLLRLLVG